MYGEFFLFAIFGLFLLGLVGEGIGATLHSRAGRNRWRVLLWVSTAAVLLPVFTLKIGLVLLQEYNVCVVCMRTLSWHKKSSAYHTVVLETENMNNRPITTLFMLASLDGKISTGYVDTLDVDPDFPRIVGVKEGLHHYYDLEKQTDSVSFNSGRVQAKIGVNQRKWEKEREDVSFVVVDNKPHLDRRGKWLPPGPIRGGNQCRPTGHPAF